MDLEAMFMSVFCIEKKPDDIFELIEAAITVGELKYPMEFKKHQNKILKQLMNAGAKEDFKNGYDSEEEEEQMDAIQSPIFEHQENYNTTETTNSSVTTEEGTKRTQSNNLQAITTTVNLDSATKVDCGGVMRKSGKGFKKTDIDADAQSKNLRTTIVNPKSVMNVDYRGVMRKSGKRLMKKTDIDSDAQSKNMQTTNIVNLKSATNGVMRKNGKGFKKTDIDADAQSNNLQTITVNLKSATNADCSGIMRKSGKGFKKMDIEADAQSKNADTTLTATKHCTEEILMNKKRLRVDFESSKRKYEDRLAEQNKAKRRTIMVDFHEMPKPAIDPCAPKRRWERRRF